MRDKEKCPKRTAFMQIFLLPFKRERQSDAYIIKELFQFRENKRFNFYSWHLSRIRYVPIFVGSYLVYVSVRVESDEYGWRKLEEKM